MPTPTLTESDKVLQRVSAMQQDASLTKAFTESECWVLAKHLHDLTGWDIAVISYAHADNWKHMGVLTPKGKFLDFNGEYENPYDVISHYVNGYVDNAISYIVDVEEWERLCSLSPDDFVYCFDVLGEDYVRDDDKNLIAVADIASDLVENII